MKTSKRENIISLIETIQEARKEKAILEKGIKEASDNLKAFMGDEHALSVPGYVAILSTRERQSFDKNALVELLGENISTYQKTTTYQTLEIKKA